VFTNLPGAMWFFFGVETLPLVTGDTIKPNKTIPKAIMAVFFTSFVLAIGVLFACCSIYPGVGHDLWFSNAPLAVGFSMIFNIKYNYALIFSVLVNYSAALGFMAAYTRQSAALEKSKLLLENLPSWLKKVHDFLPPLLAGMLYTILIMLLTNLHKNIHIFTKYYSNNKLFPIYWYIFVLY
jgi:amino acid transporter